jgi:hypothetical protein
MIFAGIDVNIITHEKLLGACEGGNLAPFGLWTFGMCHAQLHGTNGRLARAVVLGALGGKRNIVLAKKLVDSGLWIENEDGSWQVWNYDKKNQSAEEIRERKNRAAAKMRDWRDRRNGVVTRNVTTVLPGNEPVRNGRSLPRELPLQLQRVHIGTASPPPEPVTGVRLSRRKPETSCPGSDADEATVAEWAQGWKIPTAHAEFGWFLDHHRKSDARWRDWAAAWRTWLKNAPRFARGGPAPRQQIGEAASAGWMNPKENFDFGASK